MNVDYFAEKKRMIRGFGTFDTRSVTTYVRLPSGFAVNIAFKEYQSGGYLKEVLIGRQENGAETVKAGIHTYDHRYTELFVEWRKLVFLIRSVRIGDDLALSIELKENRTRFRPLCVLESAIRWNRSGCCGRDGDTLFWKNGNDEMRLYIVQGEIKEEPNCVCQTGYLPVVTDGSVYVSTGKKYSVNEIEQAMQKERESYLSEKAGYKDLGDDWEAMQTCLAWNEIYEPMGDRLTSDVSRIWNVDRGGYGMFCWDNFFASLMISLNDPARGRMNAIEILNERTDEGFVPNVSNAYGRKSFDRSQPPVGSFVCREIFRRDPQMWFLREVFPKLYTWNRWWLKARMNGKLLSWGSNVYDNKWNQNGIHSCFGGALESGLDNSPMYDADEIRFDDERSVQRLWDVGLNGLYVYDCMALSDIAEFLGEEEKAQEIREDAQNIRTAMGRLWDEENGFFYNVRTDTGEFSRRISPTCFYALLAGAADEKQYRRMVAEHFDNPNEFAGEWILPSIARNDPAYTDNTYWRGRIWAPLNFLTYIALSGYGKDAARVLAEKSLKLLLNEWKSERHLHENYNAETGDGDDVPNSDRFYHWAGLLAYIALIDRGFLPEFGKEISENI